MRDELTHDRILNKPLGNREIVLTSAGNTLCYDNISGRYFKSDVETIRRAENDINRQLRDDMYISPNGFYDRIGLSSIGVGDELGWNVDKG